MISTEEKTITLCLIDRLDVIRQVRISDGTTCAEALDLAGLHPAKTRVVCRGTVLSNAEKLYGLVDKADRVLVASVFRTC